MNRNKLKISKIFLILILLIIGLFFSGCSNKEITENLNTLNKTLKTNLTITNNSDYKNKIINKSNIKKNLKKLNSTINNKTLQKIKNNNYNKNYSNINQNNNQDKKNININKTNSKYYLHKDITATYFWVGEDATADNDYISNHPSCFDEQWMKHYGGIDSINNRTKYFFPKNFIPKENPYYFALPMSDFDDNGNFRKKLEKAPWFNSSYLDSEGNLKKSVIKNKWIKITANGKTAYAQWEDCGPFVYDDFNYVFGKNKPKNKENKNAGLDLSPAVTLYLGLHGMDKVNWQFVDYKNVPNGPWKQIITKSEFCYGKDCNYIPSKINKSFITEIYNNSKNKSWFKPKPGISWQLQLDGKLNTKYNVSLYDIDLFDTPKETIKQLHKRGIKVICYFSAGTYEDWRNDSEQFPKDVIGNKLENWEDENWLDIRKINELAPIMEERMNLAVKKGCDGIDPDNVDGYTNPTGFNLSYEDQLKYNIWLANQAHKRGLAIGLKNDLNQINDLVNYYDFAVNEQCFYYNECDKLLPFIKEDKAVLGVEYELNKSQFCNKAKEMNFSWLKMNYELNGTRDSCN
jgi:hypothetical protein